MIFIDANHFEQSVKTFYFRRFIDLKKLLKKIQNGRNLINSIYFVNRLDPDINKETYKKQQDRYKRLELIIPNFIVKQYEMKRIKEDGSTIYKERSIDIELAEAMRDGADNNLYDTAVLIAGDSDFQSTVKRIQALGKKVEFCKFKRVKAFVLRSLSDSYIELNDEYLQGCWLGDKIKPIVEVTKEQLAIAKDAKTSD
jgi:uncharacterized LabA/DUF88 family protein